MVHHELISCKANCRDMLLRLEKLVQRINIALTSNIMRDCLQEEL